MLNYRQLERNALEIRNVYSSTDNFRARNDALRPEIISLRCIMEMSWYRYVDISIMNSGSTNHESVPPPMLTVTGNGFAL